MTSGLRQRISAIDPVQHPEPYSAAEQALLVQRIISAAEPPAALTDRPQRDRSRSRRRPLLSSLAATAAAAVVALVAHGLPTSSAPATGGRPRTSSTDPSRQDAAVVTLALQKLAAAVTGPPPPSAYLYTRTQLKEVGMDRVDQQQAKRGLQSFRYAQTSIIQNWQGTTCNDRITETNAPLAFPSEADREAAIARSQELAYLRENIRGSTTTWTGPDARGLDDVPCDRLGTIGHPNPPYVATYPTTAGAFLAKVRRDLAADPDTTDVPADAGLMMILETPWLTDRQRAAGLRAFAQVPGRWKVSGSETVAGIRGLRLVVSELGTGTREELVLAARAPGVLRRTVTITDPSTADPSNRGPVEGLAPGTVIYDSRILSVATAATYPGRDRSSSGR